MIEGGRASRDDIIEVLRRSGARTGISIMLQVRVMSLLGPCILLWYAVQGFFGVCCCSLVVWPPFFHHTCSASDGGLALAC